jgi:Trk-type K+ transport system membrane component
VSDGITTLRHTVRPKVVAKHLGQLDLVIAGLTLASVKSLPRCILFAHAWNPWYGGLGIAVLAVAMLSSYNLSTLRLVEAPADEHLLTTTLGQARRITLVYLSLTLLGSDGLVLIERLGDGDPEYDDKAEGTIHTASNSTTDVLSSGKIESVIQCKNASGNEYDTVIRLENSTAWLIEAPSSFRR